MNSCAFQIKIVISRSGDGRGNTDFSHDYAFCINQCFVFLWKKKSKSYRLLHLIFIVSVHTDVEKQNLKLLDMWFGVFLPFLLSLT